MPDWLRPSAWWSGRLVWPFAILAKLPAETRRLYIRALLREAPPNEEPPE